MILRSATIACFWGGRVMRPSTIFALAVLLTSCTTAEVGQKISVESAAQIRPGVTNKSTVQSLLGAPLNRSMAASGDEQWTYNYTKMENNMVGMAVPLGTLIPGSMSSSNETQIVQVFFKGDIVSRCWINVSSSNSVNTGPLTSRANAPTTAQSDCANIGNLVAAQRQ